MGKISDIVPQLAAAGHAAGTNSHTLFWSQAEDKFKQVDSDVQGLTDRWPTTREEVRQASNGSSLDKFT